MDMHVTFESFLQEIGGFGRYQLIRVIVFQVFSIIQPICGLTSIFALYDVSVKCAIEERGVSPYSELSEEQWDKLAYPKSDESSQICRMYDPHYYVNGSTELNFTRKIVGCKEYEVTHNFVESTATADFEMFCERAPLIQTGNSLLFVGMMFGLFFGGQLADLVGRKPVLIVCQICICVITALTAFTVNAWTFLLARVGLGTFYALNYMASFTILCEMVPLKLVPLMGCIFEATFGVGLALLGVIAYFVRDWKMLQYVTASLGVPCILLAFWCPESLRWLVSAKKNLRAYWLAEEIAETNGKQFDLVPQTYLHSLTDAAEMRGENSTFRLAEMFKTPKLNTRVVILSFCWAVTSAVYYGLSLGGAMIPGNPYVNTIIMGLIEVPAMIVAYPLAGYFGRKWILVLSFFFGGLSCSLICLTSFRSYLLGTRILAQAGKFCITISFGVIYIYTFELIPTVCRSSGVSFCSLCARIGSIITPYATLLSNMVWAPMAFLLYGLITICAGIAAACLPETLNQPLQETYEDAVNFGKKSDKVINRKSFTSVMDAPAGGAVPFNFDSYI